VGRVTPRLPGITCPTLGLRVFVSGTGYVGVRPPRSRAGMIWRIGCTRRSFLNSGSRTEFGDVGCGLGDPQSFRGISASRTTSISYHSSRQHDHGEAKCTWQRADQICRCSIGAANFDGPTCTAMMVLWDV
jgi:hypothetical protein